MQRGTDCPRLPQTKYVDCYIQEFESGRQLLPLNGRERSRVYPTDVAGSLVEGVAVQFGPVLPQSFFSGRKGCLTLRAEALKNNLTS